MADYYPVLKRAISSLPASNGDARRTVYEKARAALLRQLQSYDPPLSQSDVTEQRLALEECIRRIEGEVAGAALGLSSEAPGQPPPAPPRPPAAPAGGRSAGDPAAAAPAAGASGTGGSAPPPPPASVAETRADAPKPPNDAPGAAGGTESDAPNVPIGAEHPVRDEPGRAAEPARPDSPAPIGQHRPPPPPRPDIPRPEAPRPETPEATRPDRQPSRPVVGEPSGAAGTGPRPVVTVVGNDDRRSARSPAGAETGDRRSGSGDKADQGYLDRPLGAPVPPPPRPGETRRADAIGGTRPEAEGPLGGDRQADAGADGPPQLIRRPPVKQKRGGGVAVFVAVAIVLLAVAGAAAIGWQQRESLMAMWSDPEPVSETVNEPEPPQVDVSAPQVDGLEPKIEDRLPQEGEGSPVAPDARPVQTVQVDPPPEIEFPPAEGTAPATPDGFAPSPAPAPGEATTAPAAESSATAQSADVSPQTEGVLVAQRAILYEEPIPGSDGARVDGRVLWSLVEEPVLPGEPAVPQLRAVVEIPDRNMTMTVSIRRNTDDTLPASHVAEVRFALPPDFPGRSIDTTPGLILKQTEDARGDPLVGAVAKVADNLFWVALSGTEQETLKNVALMRDRQWVDVPIRYGNRRRAILTFEKGTPGERIVQQALQAWTD